jgi:hypothetical protein
MWGINNVFAKLNTRDLKMNIQGIEYATHILHNTLQPSADILSVDVKTTEN